MISIKPTVGIILTLCSILLVMGFIIPLVYPAGTAIGLDGVAGRMDHADLWDSMDPISGFLYGFGDYCCHQMESRSIVINDNEMFICIRETSLILGLCIGLLAIVLKGEKVLEGRKLLAIMVLLFFASPLEWLFENQTGIDMPLLRSLCSIVTGIAVSFLVSRFLKWECDYLNRRSNRDI